MVVIFWIQSKNFCEFMMWKIKKYPKVGLLSSKQYKIRMELIVINSGFKQSIIQWS